MTDSATRRPAEPAIDPDGFESADESGPDGFDHDDPQPEWSPEDDWTDEALSLLRTMRAPHRRKRAGQIGFAVYCTLLILVVWGVTPSFGLLLQSSMGADYTGSGPALLAALPSGIAAAALATILFAARDGLWRGPVVPPRATADWLLPHPVEPRRVLRPWFWLSCALAAAPGIVVAAGAMVTLALTARTGLPAAFGWCVLGGVCLPLLAACAGLAVELNDRVAAQVRRFTPVLTVAVLLLVAQSVLAAQGHRIPWLERAELWSGPWGWAGLAALAPTPAAQPGAWPAAVLLLLVTAACVVLADRACGRIPPSRLRERARTAAGVLAALRTVELRAAKLAVTSASPGAGPRRVRLPAPRAGWLVVPWRDALALLRSPARLGRSVLLAIPATLCAVLAHSATGAASWAGTAVALVFGYLSVAQLLEPARVETDDIRRASWSPYPFSELMLRHTILPAALGVGAGLVGAAGAALAGFGGAQVWLAAAAVPAMVAAGLVNTCRGVIRKDLMYRPSQTPGGGAGPFLFAVWYAAGPLAAVAVLIVPFTKALTGGTASATLTAVAWSVALTAVLLWWARERAADMTTGSRSGRAN
ncbi:hypothetical protein GCM10010193_41180 [Kitasatospora atroaurantiaca]|uniref:ABC-2 type transport system permease protein n=1 Tax=Kitasatospora atroaurantiaca TaxID=285545 RepID=A0A561F1B7_9ACTN|nr:DUF6297 family protein [Kitasatospora atroaurantiaca]TWE21657.1 hypothetical protein FB465_6854 [Kitasatospora atroaurantiaca]